MKNALDVTLSLSVILIGAVAAFIIIVMLLNLN
jgi:hypothetical protein